MAPTAPFMPVSSAPAQVARSQALDGLIMGTNSSSIVSKRSVERLYYPDEPHYFRYFVKKFQRRSPLINRGYWLRLRAIDVIVKQFLSRKSGGKKVVINLGCGSDVLPWQSHVRYETLCNDVLFIDIDYPDLMHKKRAIVLETPQLKKLLGSSFEVSDSNEGFVLLKSDNYCQIGCDLRELETLQNVLETLVDLSDSSVLFVAEVSVTYMDTESADNLLQWARSVGKAEFCLLEQLLPYGPGHPFAQTMLKHFDKLQTPPRSVGQYPTIDDQRKRFTSRGWSRVRIWDLWEAWCCGTFVNPQERMALDAIEPFDEWEELMLFGRHYFVLHASASESIEEMNDTTATAVGDKLACGEISMHLTTLPGSSKRRFGASATIQNAVGQNFGLHMMGLGSNTREDSCDIYSLDGAASSPAVPVTGPSPRMCFTTTDLGSYGILLVGGRASPARAFSDCWILSKGNDRSWKATWKLPVPLYRHSSLRLSGTSLVLVAGGKTCPSQISEDYYVFNPEQGWLHCRTAGDVPKASFGSILCNDPAPKRKLYWKLTGFICGGLEKTGLIVEEKYGWALDMAAQEPVITFTKLKNEFARELSIFGATSVAVNGNTIICGGMGADPAVDGQAIYSLSFSGSKVNLNKIKQSPDDPASKPFMIGSTVLHHRGCIIIAGGGMTCFSMGTFWETNVYQAQVPEPLNTIVSMGPNEGDKSTEVKFLSSHRVICSTSTQKGDISDASRVDAKARMLMIPRVSVASASEFEAILRREQPVIIENLQLGSCLQEWTAEYMSDRVGSDRQVVVHECQVENGKMDFNAKNFRYVTDSFGAIMARARNGDRLYLRSLSNDKPAEEPANLAQDFPGLAADFILPDQLAYVREQLFSSVLRVSGRVNMWLHYDVMANVYAQIVGTKRMILFPPSDVPHLAFAPGASSSSLDVFAALETSKLAGTHPHEATINPGDVLFLPQLWLHTATPTTDMSVAVNVFFRHLESGYAVGRDVYGNRDLAAYEKGRQDVAKIAKQFQQLSEETRKFYLSRLADELVQAAEGT